MRNLSIIIGLLLVFIPIILVVGRRLKELISNRKYYKEEIQAFVIVLSMSIGFALLLHCFAG